MESDLLLAVDKIKTNEKILNAKIELLQEQKLKIRNLESKITKYSDLFKEKSDKENEFEKKQKEVTQVVSQYENNIDELSNKLVKSEEEVKSLKLSTNNLISQVLK